MRYWMTFLCFVATGVFVSAEDTICKAPQATGLSLILDARNGSLSGPDSGDPPKRVAQNDTVRVWIVNKNPFLFKYQFEVKSEAIYDESLGAFLTFLGVPKLPEEKADGGAETALFDRLDDGCSPQEQTTIEDANNDLQSRLGKIRDDLGKIGDTVEQFNDLRQKINDPDYDSCKVLDAAQEIQQLKSVQFDTESISKEIEDTRVEAKKVGDQMRRFPEHHPDCHSLFERARRLAEYAESLPSVLDRLKKTNEEAAKTLQALKTMQGLVDKILSQPRPFWESHLVGPYDEGTKATLTLKRKSVKEGAEFANLVTHEIAFDSGPRFALAGGLAFSGLGEPKYARVQSVADDQSVSNVVGRESDSGSRIKPLLMLHSRLLDLGQQARLYFSVGVTADGSDDGVNVEYLVGPSIGLLQDRFFVTVGGYRGVVQTLGGGLKVGKPVPEGLAELPLEDRARWRIGFALTYNIR